MSLSHGSFTFSHVAGIIQQGMWRQPIQTITFPGIKGVTHVVDSVKERQLTIEYTMLEFASESALKSALNNIDNHMGEDGTLDDGSVSYEKCTFLGFQRSQIQYSAGGAEGYFVIGQLMFTQRKL